MSTDVEQDRYEVAVVGAGQAGLAIGALLARQGRRFVILEAADAVGAAWRSRWDSLVLFTPRRFDALPGLSFPGDADGYPTRDEVVAYLERYAAHFDLPVELSSPVRSLRKDAAGFVLQAGERTIRAERVVVATGPFQKPMVPALAGGLAPEVFRTHSAGYRNPAGVPLGCVLVVGGGNTGFQIAKELAPTHEVHLAIGSRQTPLPQRLLGRDLFWWLTKLGLLAKTVDSRVGRRARGRDTLIGSSPRQLRRHGVVVRPRAVRADGRTVGFEDGGELEVDAVIWATGYRPDHSWIDLPVHDADGRLRHRRGVSGVEGLYFLGLSWQHTRGSALLGFVADDTAFIAGKIGEPYEDARRAHDDGQAPHAQGASEGISTMDHHDHHHHHHEHAGEPEPFPTATDDLPAATAPRVVELADGETFELRIGPVAKRIGDDIVRMLAYNGSVPGPVLRVREGAELVVDVVNDGDLEGTVHWHGLRLDNRFDGTHETQAPIPVGGRFSYRIAFPDPGVYWYHPHVREDYGQELGQYGNILVVPGEDDYWPPAHRDLLLTLDDVLIEDGRIASFSREETTYAAMGRYGNVLLIGGETEPSFAVRRGEVVRLYLTNTANTRVFNVGLPGARMKLVGGDSGRVEHEELVESVVLAPSERVVVDVLFEHPGRLTMEHRTPERTYTLATIDVGDEPATPRLGDTFGVLRHNPEWSDERRRLAPYADAAPDKTLAFVAEMEMPAPDGPVVYACPMHPDVVGEDGDRCPKCGMKLLAMAAPTTYVCPMHPEIVSESADRCPRCGMKLVAAALVAAAGHAHNGHGHDADAGHGDAPHAHHGHGHDAGGIEWEDDMVEVNRLTTPANTRWKLVDRDTGAENHAIDWQFTVGDRVKLRLVNEMDSDHPMHHPFHVHGAGRFVVLARDGAPERNLVWKDTVLVRTGETVDILLDVTNPGRWMAHCHIAEHHESGMMLSFDVVPAGGGVA